MFSLPRVYTKPKLRLYASCAGVEQLLYAWLVLYSIYIMNNLVSLSRLNAVNITCKSELRVSRFVYHIEPSH